MPKNPARTSRQRVSESTYGIRSCGRLHTAFPCYLLYLYLSSRASVDAAAVAAAMAATGGTAPTSGSTFAGCFYRDSHITFLSISTSERYLHYVARDSVYAFRGRGKDTKTIEIYKDLSRMLVTPDTRQSPHFTRSHSCKHVYIGCTCAR